MRKMMWGKGGVRVLEVGADEGEVVLERVRETVGLRDRRGAYLVFIRFSK